MLTHFAGLNPVHQALLAGLFTWGLTALGAGGVFLSREMNRRRLDAMLGFAAGVMIAASFWSLLLPALELSGSTGLQACIPAAVGFIAGGVFLRGLDALLPHLHPGYPLREAEGPGSSLRRTTLLVIAITMHNIPEGLAVGVTFGAVATGLSYETLGAAIALTVGIGLQNFPEGFAVSAPLAGKGIPVSGASGTASSLRL
ncbi:ZIP family metal transporter [Methanoculleus sp.]|uniref:ZIP family metal transporter n=1 Tax=Methanoculleus sp. TaxID=90427 RepID=UPI002606213F|nr:ZIP family metal transporter [Methanoculleus sp.]